MRNIDPAMSKEGVRPTGRGRRSSGGMKKNGVRKKRTEPELKGLRNLRLYYKKPMKGKGKENFG